MKRTLFLDIDYRLQTVLQTVFVIVITTLTQLAVVAVLVPAADSLELTVLVPLTSLSREICDDLSERFPISRLSLPSSFSFSHFFASPDLSSCSERNILSFNQTGTVELTVHSTHYTISCNFYFVKNNRADSVSQPGGRMADLDHCEK